MALISISVDPTTDVPARLKAHAEKSGAAAGWTFVTGRKTDIDPLLRALGAMTGDAADHTGAVLVGNDAAGHWTRINAGFFAPPIIETLTEAAAKRPARATATERGRGS